MELVLFEPEIPPNTGNVARLCAATKTPLHLVEPLGFRIDDRSLKRAGLDYWPHVDVTVHPDWDSLLAHAAGRRLVLSSARRGERFDRFAWDRDDLIVLGPETRGLPEDLPAQGAARVRIPIWGQVRSLNMSTAAGVLLYAGLAGAGLLPDVPGDEVPA